MKKKAMLVLVLAVVLVLAFSTIAMAKYAGAFQRGTDNDALAGYLTWDGANAIYARDTGTAGPQSSVHGGYSTTSVKCVVCHSAHRAASDSASTGIDTIEDHHLTNAGSCINCHTTFGAGGSAKKIEAAEDPAVRGPHHGLDCTMCHGNIHGGNGSKFYMMDAYMLGGDQDAKIEAAVANGNWSIGEGSPWASAPVATGRNWSRTNLLPLPASGVDGIGTEDAAYTIDGTARTWSTKTTGYGYWWVNGDGRYYTSGTEVARPVPAGSATQAPQPAGVSDVAYGAAKAMATGYVCAECHDNSHFAVNTWGYSEEHEARQGTSNVALTGHGTGAWMHAGGNPSCAPCHPGGASGGYRLALDGQWGNPALGTGLSPRSSMAFGCDQCHDIVGKATDSTAWPHGNRGIVVYEWDRATPGTVASKTEKTLAAASHNIWMYGHDIGVPATIPQLRGEGSHTIYSGDSPEFAALTTQQQDDMLEEYEQNADGSRYLVSTNGNPNYWNAKFKVIENAVGGNADDIAARGVINDSVCLKCHVAIDSRSVESRGGSSTVAVNPGGISSHHHYYVGEGGALKVLPELGTDTWNIGDHDPSAPGQDHYIGHAQLIYLFK